MINNTMYLTGGKSSNPLSPPTNLAAKAGNAQVTLTWTDPPNATSEPSGQTIATWAYTLIVRKQGSQPTGPSDGTLVVKSSVRDQYQTTGYIDTNLTNDTTYYYGAFAYNSDGVYSEGAFVSATPQAGTPIGNLAEGTLITIKENGAPVEFYVAKQNYEPELNGNGRTLVVRKYVGDFLMQWNSTNANAWANCSLRSWMNGSYKSLLSSSVQQLIGTTTYHYTPGNNNWTVSTRADAVFALSLTELGKSATNANAEGSALPIASTLQTVYKDGVVVVAQWTRSPSTDSPRFAWYIENNGIAYEQYCSRNEWGRPCFTLPATALVDTNNALIES